MEKEATPMTEDADEEAPRWRGINHLALITNDMDATVRFYHGVLGARLIATIGTPYFRHYFFEFAPHGIAGLFAFFYGCLHFTTYLWLDKFFDFHEIVKDVWKRPFITVGFLGFICMAPLALTSTAGWIRRLGGRRWQMLHRLIYVSAIAGVVHYYWLVKSDVRKPLLYGAIVLLLLGERVVVAVRKSGVNLKGWTLKKPGGGNTASVSKPRASSSVR